MPRVKIAPKRVSNGSSLMQPRRKREKVPKVTHLKIYAAVPQDCALLKCITLPWTPLQDVTSPKFLQIFEDGRVLTNNYYTVIASSEVCRALQNRQVYVIFKEASSTELVLSVAVRLPLQRAQFLVECLFDKDYSTYEQNNADIDAESWQIFFKDLEVVQATRQVPIKDFQHPCLVPTLRGYQSSAVAWMVERELNPGCLDVSWLNEVADLLTTDDGETVMYAKYSGVLYSELETIPCASGGILADEMGLGKTVMALALILNQPCTELGDWDVKESPNKVSCSLKSLKRKKSGESQRDLLQESRLSADEKLQLVPTSRKKGLLRQQLNAWYETKLAEMRVSQGSYKEEQRIFKCLCGDEMTTPKKAVQCTCCGIFQHSDCCGRLKDHVYVCPSCWRLQQPYPSRCTLIVAPPAIFDQWASEIERHTPDLKLIQYHGNKDLFMQPALLSDFDIVLTTYSVLRAECAKSDEPNQRAMRRESRFLHSSSTLEKVAWWRVICDEAQLVESDFSLVRQMTSRLTATHRWCVTGTPIQKSVADLYYLTSFMGIGVFDLKPVWTELLLTPYLAGCKNPLLSVIQQVFWRSTKDQVHEQIGVPGQTFKIHMLKFSAIEEAFYMQEHARSESKFRSALSHANIERDRTIESVNKKILNKILHPLLNIRQACTHPQVVHGINISTKSEAANLGELLEYLLTKTKQECEEALRAHVLALNGLAGLHCLQDDWGLAMENYRAVIRLAEEYQKDEARIDPLQRIHALWNAAEILENHPNCAPPTLRDEKLRAEASEISAKYLSKAIELFNSSRSKAEPIQTEVRNFFSCLSNMIFTWWVPVVLSCAPFERELVDRLSEKLHSNDPRHKKNSKRFLARIKTLCGIQMVVQGWWENLTEQRKAVMKLMKILMDLPCDVLVAEALGCHLRLEDEKIKTCQLCVAEQKMQDYECELFDTTKKDMDSRGKVTGPVTTGSWTASYSERTLVEVFNFAKGKVELEEYCIKGGGRDIMILEDMKKEFKHTRAAWTALNDRIHAEDELTMAKSRLRLAKPWEVRAGSVEDNPSLVEIHQIPMSKVENARVRDDSLVEFKRKMGKLFYLKNLAKDKNITPDPCPVCRSAIEQQWSVLHCGHCFCLDCLQMLQQNLKVRCPVCRESTAAAEIGFVDTTATANPDDISVVGALSTKVDSIVREVMRLVIAEPAVKILVFSTWTEVLKILHHAFTINNVSLSYAYPGASSVKRVQNMARFRSAESGVNVLLLPLAWGSKGLNLVEATHVFLVEPILNPSEELQAIGRVHRIGQTRETVVHRFIIKNSVEEKIFSAVSEAKDKWSNNVVRFRDLETLFAIPPVGRDDQATAQS